MAQVDRLAMLAQDAIAAGATSADGFATFVTTRAPDLADAARALGDLVARGLATPLSQNAYPASEDAPIANDLSARLGVPMAAAQAAVAAARGMGGAAAPYHPPVAAGGQPGALPPRGSKPIWKRWWFWLLLVLVAGGLLFAKGLRDYRANRATVLVSPQTVHKPMLQLRQDADRRLVGVRFRLGDKSQAGKVENHGLFYWPVDGLRTGEGEGIIGFKDQLTAYRDKPAYRVAGPFEIEQSGDRAIAVLTARDQTVVAGSGVVPMTFTLIGKPGTKAETFRFEDAEMACILTAKNNPVDPREGCGLVPEIRTAPVP